MHFTDTNHVVAAVPIGGIHLEGYQLDAVIDGGSRVDHNKAEGGIAGGLACRGGELAAIYEAYLPSAWARCMIDGARIDHNGASTGGGIQITGPIAHAVVTNGASIDSNTATRSGGGISLEHALVTVKNGSEVHHNQAHTVPCLFLPLGFGCNVKCAFSSGRWHLFEASST